MAKKKETSKVNNLQDLEGIGPITLKKLIAVGVKIPHDIIMMGSQELSQVTGKDKDESIKIVENVKNQLEDAGKLTRVRSWKELEDWEAKQFHLPCGCSSLDNMLGGGIESQGLTEIYGEEGAGKTQWMETLVVNTASNAKAVFIIDCEGTTNTKRMLEIASVRGLQLDVNKILLARVQDADELESVVKSCTQEIIDNDVKLILVDGLMGKYRMEYDRGRGELNTRQNDIKVVIRRLQNMAEYLNIAVLLTNQVMGNPDSGWGADPIKPIGGHVYGHNVKHIIKITKGKDTKRIARIIKSHKFPKYDCEFYLNAAGVWPEETFKSLDAVLTSNFGSEREELSESLRKQA